MATITASNVQGSGIKALTLVTLTGTADTFTYTASRNPILILRNPTASPITATIDGDGATTVAVGGVGNVDISSGYSTGSIAADAEKVIVLSTISKYLAGTIAITGGTGLVCSLLEF